MDLVLKNFTSVEYTVVTTYEDGYKAYSIPTTDKSVADDYMDRLTLGLFGPSTFGRVRSIVMIKRTTTVKEEAIE